MSERTIRWYSPYADCWATDLDGVRLEVESLRFRINKDGWEARTRNRAGAIIESTLHGSRLEAADFAVGTDQWKHNFEQQVHDDPPPSPLPETSSST